nr:uncharacterized protein LOC112275138 isoform X1 [Physcomitrium patens]|eukprot:XP_024360975.1 uncharacterized protein LOC112275138 isoform X1 [Physcomitrella patens]
MAALPRCSLLFADSFHHDRLCQHVDEVRFTEPVVITACEVVELHQPSRCPTLALKGITSPESCALEFYVRSGRDSRFQRLGPAFLHSPAAIPFLDVQAAVTEHLVLRGSYKSLTLVIYGNLASELCVDNNPDTNNVSQRATSKIVSLREILCTQPSSILSLSNLQLYTPPTKEQGTLLQRLIKYVDGRDATQHMVSMLLTAAAAWHLSHQRQREGAQWCALKKDDPLDGSRSLLCDDSIREMSELHNLLQQKEGDDKHTSSDEANGRVLVQLSLHWLQVGLDPSAGLNSSISAVESLLGGLAAVQLLFTSCPKDVPAFLAGGGMRLLHQVVEEISGTSALLLFALTSVECTLRHASGCEEFSAQDKRILLSLLEKKQRPPVVSLLQRILQRLRCYELAVTITQRLVEPLTNLGSAQNSDTIKEASKLLNGLLIALSIKSFVESTSVEYNWVKQEAKLPTSAGSCYDDFTSLSEDVDCALLSILQETSFMESLAAFSSVPHIWPANGSAPNVSIEFASATQRFLLRLLECRSGLLFLGADMESLTKMITGLKSASEQELEVLPIRHVTVLSSLGYLCTPGSMAETLHSRISMVSAADRFVGADAGSDAAFGALWDLASMSRSEAGRQAILAIVSFPEVLTALIEAIHPSPDLAESMGGAGGHFATEALQKVFCDSALVNQIALTVHASALQTALQAACNSGMNSCSKLVEWVEAAVVYQKKGAVGLLKHATALIGPLNTSMTIHVDGSMGDDANNLHDRAPGSELPNSISKGTGSTPIQYSAIHALTISLRLLASAGWNLEVAASLYGDGAVGVVNIILEHCVAALQASSNEFDDEDTEEDEGRGEDFHKEQALLALLLPTLILLLSLLKCLQSVVQHFCSTRLLDLLTQLHHVISAKAGAHETAPPYSWTGEVLELGAVQQVLASLLAFWPVQGWTPALMPRLFGSNSTSLPMEPTEACSVICLLEEFLPPECPRTFMDKAAVLDVYRTVAVGNIHGVEVMPAVYWHTSPKHTDKMLHVLSPFLEQIGQLVVHLASCTCDVVQERLTNLVVRLACQSSENAVIVLRPVLSVLRQRTAAAAKSLLSETDVLQVTHMLRWIALLTAHASSKALLLQEGIVQMLLQVISLEATPSIPVGKSGWLMWSLRTVARLCDTEVCFLPAASVARHISEDCPNYDDCCAIASSLLQHCQLMHVEPQIEVLADAFEKLASHDVGRAAVASVALGHAGCATHMNNHDTPESQISGVFHKASPPFLKLWQNLVSAMGLVELNPVLVRLVRRFAQVAIVLTESGHSSVGGVALRALFGLDVSSESTESKTVGERDDKLEAPSCVVSILQQHLTDIEDSNATFSVFRSSLHEALSAVSSMLNYLTASEKEIVLREEIELLINRLPAARPVAERRAEAIVAQSSSCFGLVSFMDDGVKPMDTDISEAINGESKGTIPWDCPKLPHERPVMKMRTSKRRVISTIEVASKRQRGDGATSAVASRTPVLVTSSRRDTFRLRKPNTSRPPSMHVDDYVAREKSSDVLSGSSPAAAATTLQRSNSGTRRAPSIHVDEFMARQRENQQSDIPLIQGYAENGGSRAVLDLLDGDNGADLCLTDRNLRISQTTAEYSSVSVIVSSVATFSAAPPPALAMMNTSVINSEVLQRNPNFHSASEHTGFSSQRLGGMKMEQNNGGTCPGVEINSQPPSSVVKVKLERAPSMNSVSAGLPSPFQPYEQEFNAAVAAAVKMEPRQQPDSNIMPRTLHAEVPAAPPQQQASQSDLSSHLPPPPPPAPPSPWLDQPRRLDPSLLPPVIPRLIPGMNVLPYNHGSGSRPPADLQVGGVVLQPPAGLWRDSTPVFSGLPPPAPPIPGPNPHGPQFVQQSFMGASRPLDTLQGYPGNHAGTASTSDHRFGNLSGPPSGQGSSPLFQPPIPTGMPPSQNTLSSEQSVHRPPPLHLQESEIIAQQEPGAVLQQILQSPDTIHELLKDTKKLQQLLEQHPKLVALLQEKISHGML